MAEQPKADNAPDAAVQAELEVVEAQLSYQLSDDDRKAVRGNIERHMKMAAKLRAVPIVNADEPDFVFRPYRAEG